jgi:putative peptidoglycan lipid II flippase
MSRRSGLLSAAALIAAVTVLSRLLGFGRWLAQANGVGVGAIADAYNSANLLPNVLFEVAAGGALAGAIVPMLAGLVARGEREQVDRVVAATLGWTLLVLVPLGVLLAVMSGPIANWLPDVEPEMVSVVRYFLVVFAIQVPLYGCAVLLYGVLQAHRRFFWPAFAPALASAVTIATYLAYGALANGEWNDPSTLQPAALDVLAWGTTAGVAAMVVPLLVPVRRAGVRLRVSLRFPDGVGRRILALASAGVVGLVAQQLASLVAMLTARAHGAHGTYSVFLITQAVYLLPYAILVVPLATSTFPRLAERASAGDHDGFAMISSVMTRGVLLAGGLGAALLVAIGPSVATVFTVVAGTTDDALVAEMGPTMALMAVGVIGYGLLFHLSRALYARHRGRDAAIGVAGGWLTTAALAVVGTAVVDGSAAVLHVLGASVGIGMMTGAVVLLAAMVREAGRESVAGLGRTAIVLVLGGVPAAFVGWWVGQRLQGDGLISGLVSGAGAAAVTMLLLVGAVWLGDRATLTQIRAAGADDDTPGDASSSAAGEASDLR